MHQLTWGNMSPISVLDRLEDLRVDSGHFLLLPLLEAGCLRNVESVTFNNAKVTSRPGTWGGDEGRAEVADLLLALPHLETIGSSEVVADHHRGIRGTKNASLALDDLEALVALHPQRWRLEMSRGHSRRFRRI